MINTRNRIWTKDSNKSNSETAVKIENRMIGFVRIHVLYLGLFVIDSSQFFYDLLCVRRKFHGGIIIILPVF